MGIYNISVFHGIVEVDYNFVGICKFSSSKITFKYKMYFDIYRLA